MGLCKFNQFRDISRQYHLISSCNYRRLASYNSYPTWGFLVSVKTHLGICPTSSSNAQQRLQIRNYHYKTNILPVRIPESSSISCSSSFTSSTSPIVAKRGHHTIITTAMGSSLSSSSSSFTPSNRCGIPPVKVYKPQDSSEKRCRRLIQLLRLNHANFGVLFNNLRFHNHMPHILGSSYILGADEKKLDVIYDSESKSGLVPWPEPPQGIGKHDWRTYLGKKEYERAFLDFFEDELVEHKYDWMSVLAEYLFEGEEPLVNGLIGGLGHPLIHLGYALELDNREVAMEALTQAACAYDSLHTYPDNEHNHNTPAISSRSPLEIINRIRNDTNFDGLLSSPGAGNSDELFEKLEPQIASHIWALILDEESESDIKKQFEKLVDTAIWVFASGHKRDDPQYDFFLVHLVTTAHAVRILLPYLPQKNALPVLRAHWTLFVVCYLTQMRPLVKEDVVMGFDTEGKGWDYVVDKCLNGEHRLDAHYVKGLRALKEFAEVFGEKDGLYLKAAVKFADQFDGWIGFGGGGPQLDIKK